jgi:hypothetical protein
VLGEDAWEHALRRTLSEPLADRIVVKDPSHPHHTAWRELHALANEEVARVGADPDRLAGIIERVLGSWRGEIKAPAAAAHFALTQARELPRYEEVVNPAAAASAPGDRSTIRVRRWRGRVD